MKKDRKIVIVGGGISGLTAAYRLQKLAREQNIPVRITLLEASSRLGGASDGGRGHDQHTAFHTGYYARLRCIAGVGVFCHRCFSVSVARPAPAADRARVDRDGGAASSEPRAHRYAVLHGCLLSRRVRRDAPFRVAVVVHFLSVVPLDHVGA